MKTNKEKSKNFGQKKFMILKEKKNNLSTKKINCTICGQEIEDNKLKEHLQYNHITEIMNKVYLGSYKNAKNYEELEKSNIKYILNCASECENLFGDKIKYLKLDIKDQPDFPIQDYFDKGIQFIKDSLNNNDGSILIHCMEGRSRSATLLMAYLIKCNGENTNSAYKILKSKRQLIMPNLGFMYKLREYEKTLNK